MHIELLHNKTVISNILKREPGLNFYSIGDLDDLYWPRTTWYALNDGNEILSIALLYASKDNPTLLVFCSSESYLTQELIKRIRYLLPSKFYAHLSPGLIDIFGKQNILEYYGYFFNKTLIGVSGIHVYSEEFKVAALGNIATHPDFRGKQIGYKLTCALCFDSQRTADIIGLNVNSNNEYALKCYKNVGFEIIGSYDECYIKNDIYN